MKKKVLLPIGLIIALLFGFSSPALAIHIDFGEIVAACEKVGEQYVINYTINATAYGLGNNLSYELLINSSSATLSETGSFSTPPDGNVTISGTVPIGCGTYTISGILYWPDLDSSVYPNYQLATIVVECECYTPGGEGCTPGFWKNHEEAWATTAYSPNDDFDTVFGVDFFDPDITLFEAVWARGGGANKMARHGTAALLNASSAEVDFGFTTGDIIQAVQAGDVDFLVEYNELTAPGFCD